MMLGYGDQMHSNSSVKKTELLAALPAASMFLVTNVDGNLNLTCPTFSACSWYKDLRQHNPSLKMRETWVMSIERDIEFRVGRRAEDGTIRLTAYPPQLVQLSVSYKGERSSSFVLTRSQVSSLRQTLEQFERAMDGADSHSEVWDGNERRAG